MGLICRKNGFCILCMILCVFAAASVSGCGGDYNELLQTEGSAEDIELIRAGYAGSVGEWIYYSNYEDEGRLYKIRYDGSDDTRILQDKGHFLSLVKGWIYYTGNYMDGYKLYRVKDDGSSKTMVSSGDFKHSSIYGGYIYYVHTINTADESDMTELYRMDLESGEIKYVARSVLMPRAYDEHIYYINPDDGNKLYGMGLDGSGKARLCGGSLSSLFVYNGWVYFTATEYSSSLYRVRTDGMLLEKIADMPEGACVVNVYGDCVYYTDMQKGLYSIRTDGLDDKLVCHMWSVPVSNMEAWGINPDDCGAYIQDLGGFVPLYRALDHITCYELPGCRLANSYGSGVDLEISDIMDDDAVYRLKERFADILYVYPAGLYLERRCIQCRIALGVKDTSDRFLDSVLEYLSYNIEARPAVIVFTVLEEGRNVAIHSIGYIAENDRYIQPFSGGYSYIYDKEFSGQLTGIYAASKGEGNNDSDEDDGSMDVDIFVNGYYDGLTGMYSAEVGVFITGDLPPEQRMDFIDGIIGEINKKHDNPWLAVILYDCETNQRNLMDKEILSIGCRFPRDSITRMIYNR